ncbi:thioredoxin family protein [Flexithrix dorotheae]|uniref:thioredoxin family protein n=1 Tax=Flexithrix dorotheae TaxID=70993 RepID=UPI0012FC1C32|nr:DUF255 domain-containing protein [Flexithrix dorotheae]
MRPNIHFYIIALIFTVGQGFGQSSEISWLNFDQLEDTMRSHPQKVIIKIETDWCKYCKLMDKTTFKDPEIVAVLNANYYLVKLDAESKSDIKFLGRNYTFKPSGKNNGIHELAEVLGRSGDGLEYPTITFLSERFQPIINKNGYLNKKDFLRLITTVKDNF